MLTAERVRHLLHYDPDSGVFTRRVTTAPRAQAGMIAGTINSEGYWQIRVDGRLYKAHRLAWLHTHGVWPERDLDHWNLDRSDNRLDNLRPCDNSLNQANTRVRSHSKSGIKGVRQDHHGKSWFAYIVKGGKRRVVGYFPTKEQASAAYAAAARETFGEFARVN